MTVITPKKSGNITRTFLVILRLTSQLQQVEPLYFPVT